MGWNPEDKISPQELTLQMAPICASQSGQKSAEPKAGSTALDL